MDRFRVETLTATPNPQQTIWAAMHQDYSEEWIAAARDRFPEEAKAGELVIKHLLQGNRGHYGPLEHPQIVLSTGFFPHSTMQQVRTHRVGVSFDVQCLAGETEITFVNINGEPSPKLRKTIAELYDLWTHGEKAIRDRKIRGRNGELPGQDRRDCKKRLRKMRLRVLNERTGLFEVGHLKDVLCSGVQPVYRLSLENGRTLDCTVNHRLLTDRGWQTMGEAVGLHVDENGEVVSLEQDRFILCNGISVRADEPVYQNRAWLADCIARGLDASEMSKAAGCSSKTLSTWAKRYGLTLSPFPRGQKLAYDLENLATVCVKCHQQMHANHEEVDFANAFLNGVRPETWQPKPRGTRKLKAHPVRVIAVEYVGLKMTYDLEVEGSWHNFVANGAVVHNSFRYTGSRIIDVVEGKRDLEDVFYLRPVGSYTNRQGKKYLYSQEQRDEDRAWCLEACKRYQERIAQGLSEEHARGLIPFDVRQNFVLSCNARSLMHLLDLRAKADAQLEIQKLSDLLFEAFEVWMPEIAGWYRDNRLGKARLSP